MANKQCGKWFLACLTLMDLFHVFLEFSNAELTFIIYVEYAVFKLFIIVNRSYNMYPQKHDLRTRIKW